MSQRHAQLDGNTIEDRPDRLLGVHVLVRVEMGGIAPQELAAERELRAYLRFDGANVPAVDPLVQRDPLAAAIDPFAEVDVESNTQPRVRERIRGSGRCGMPAHHQAGARHDSALVRLYDAAVDPVALTEIVG